MHGIFNLVTELIGRHGFSAEYFVAVLVFLLPLNKKKHHLAWEIAGGVCILLISIVTDMTPVNKWMRIGSFFLIYLVGVELFRRVIKGTVWDAVYGATCAYAAQHLSYAILSFCEAAFKVQTGKLLQMAIFAAVMALCYLIFAKNMALDGDYHMSKLEAIGSVVVIIPFAFVLSMLAEEYYRLHMAENLRLFLICRLYAILCCVFVLYVQVIVHLRMDAQMELQAKQIVWDKKLTQYELSKENIALINRKCHDLKHQVAALREVASEQQREQYLEDLEKAVGIYDAVIETGNEVIDTILTEKSLLCEREHITWSCVIDGSKLNFMNPIDLYTLFGNAVDNAVESVRKIADPQKRVITLTQRVRPGMVVLQLENYYEGDLVLKNGLPKTSKGDEINHGYGVRSIQEIAEKYGGSISIDGKDNIFLLSILIPIEG